MGCTDHSIDICRQHGAKVIHINPTYDYSTARNQLIDASDGLILYINPWEVLVSGHEEILSANEPHYVTIARNDLITKEVRLWPKKSKLLFQNPIFETVICDQATLLPALIYSKGGPKDTRTEELIQGWLKESPASSSPYYYQACNFLAHGKYEDFIRVADHFLFLGDQEMPVTMTRYYYGQVHLHIKRNYDVATKQAMLCLANRPLMAEFWCLLGDVCYSLKKYQRARSLYENAIILGERRLESDLWPMQVSKYKDYP
jgi:glycosyltransferase involved in cell wall biosynthesis